MNSGAARCWLPRAQRGEKGGRVCGCKMEIRTSEDVGERKKKYWMQNECCEADELGLKGGRESVRMEGREGVSGVGVKMSAKPFHWQEVESYFAVNSGHD